VQSTTTPTTARRAIAYLRVSTDEQTESGLGLGAQTTTIMTAVHARQWSLVASLVDEGRSGGTMVRPALTEALEALDAGHADVLVVAKLDRLSRSVLDFATITDRARRRGWSVVALDVDVDTSTPTGALVANITSSVAQWEREIIASRTRDALAVLKASGVRLGRPVTLPDEVRRRIAAERATGRTLQAIADGLTADGISTARGGRWRPCTISAVLASLDLDAVAA
jgi:DNA invertase Pin-like site-specific DNA recombinase